MSIVIAKAGDSHLAQLLELNRKLAHRDEHPIRHAFLRGEIILAIEREQVLGYAAWNDGFFENAFMWQLATDPAYRRRGIARALIDSIAEIAGRGNKLFTSTNQSNVIAQRTFESLGFIRSGIVENLDPGDPEWFYFKQL
jgi:ribosomal protein S18 acetylase RimI-like enzyme